MSKQKTARWYLVLDTHKAYEHSKFFGCFDSLAEAIRTAKDPEAEYDKLDDAADRGSELGPVYWPSEDEQLLLVGERFIFEVVLPDPPPECCLCGNNSTLVLEHLRDKNEWVCTDCLGYNYATCANCQSPVLTDSIVDTGLFCSGEELSVVHGWCQECIERNGDDCHFELSPQRARCTEHGTEIEWQKRQHQLDWIARDLREALVEVEVTTGSGR